MGACGSAEGGGAKGAKAVVQFLQSQTPLGKYLDKDTLADFAAYFTEQRYPTGATIFAENHGGSDFFIVAKVGGMFVVFAFRSCCCVCNAKV